MELDRLGPTRRPPRREVGYQRWRSLLFLHWPLEPALVRPLLPRGLELDTHDGLAWIGLVPFVMRDVRFVGTPRPLALDFLETNVRTYVHVNGADPGVYFFSLDAASRLAVWGARAGFGLPYHHARMGLERDGERIAYRVQRGRRGPSLQATWELGAPRAEAAPGTLDHFLIERYLLHVRRGGRIWTGHVHHRPYPLRSAQLLELDDELVAAAGLPRPRSAPLVHASDGVDVEIFAPRPNRARRRR